MSTNVLTSKRITYMYCHVDEVGLEVIFFFQRNILIGSFLFFKIFIFYFFSKLHFVFPLTLHFESSSNSFSFLLYTLNPLPICHPYIHYIYIKDTIVEKPNFNFFREFFQSLNVLQPI